MVKINITLLTVLIYLVIIDFITGFLKGKMTDELSSDKMFKGGYRKILIFIILSFGFIFDYFQDSNLSRLIKIFYITQESLSIYENINPYIEFPNKIEDKIENYKED